MNVKREMLYDEVWAEPMTVVAKRYDVSGSFLARICDRLNVPRPKRGYWAKLAVGKVPSRPPLRMAPPGSETVWSRRDRPKRPELSGDSCSSLGLGVPPPIDVPGNLVDPHPLVAYALADLEGEKPQEDGFLPSGKHKGLQIHTTPACLARASRLADTLLKAAEGRGHKALARSGASGGAVIVVGDQAVGLSIVEDTDRVPHNPTNSELVERRKYPWHQIPKYDERPSGRLAFIIDTVTGERGRFGEGKRARQEENLVKVLLAIESASVSLKARRLEREAREREWEEAERRRKEAARREAEEKALVVQLSSQLIRRRLAREIRELVTDLRSVPIPPESTDRHSDHDEYLNWATGYANRIDPVERTRASLQTGETPPLPPLPEQLR
jgi:hypothetical protein